MTVQVCENITMRVNVMITIISFIHCHRNRILRQGQILIHCQNFQ